MPDLYRPPTRTPLRRGAAAIRAAAILAACAACGPAADDTSGVAPLDYPAGTVIGIDGHAITEEDVERYLPMLELIEPQFVRRDHIRKILSNITIPVAAGAALLPEDRDVAFQRAEALLATVRETGALPADAPEAMVLEGSWADVGMVSWAEAMHMEAGTYSSLHETPGAWTFIELVNAGDAPGDFSPLTSVTVRRYDVPYLPAEARRELVRDAMETLAIDIVDPAWEPLIPPLYLYRNQGSRSVTPETSEQDDASR